MATAKKIPAKNSSAKKTAVKKIATTKTTAKKVAAKAPAAKKAPAKKTTGKKYSAAAGKSVEREMKAMHEGTLKSGSGEKVTNPKQAIAIGLSEARKAGAKVPPPPQQVD